MKTPLTFEVIESTLREVIAESPDFVYSEFRKLQLKNMGMFIQGQLIDCVYFDEDNEPGCVFGNVLAKLGYGPEDVQEGNSISAVLKENLEVDLNREQAYLLDDIQSYQDNLSFKKTWKESLDQAYEELANGNYKRYMKVDNG